MKHPTNYKRPNDVRVALSDDAGAVSDDPKYRCCCGMHVKSAAAGVAYFGLFFSIFIACSAAVSRSPMGTLSWMFNAILFGCILYGQSSHVPGFFLPYLIIEGIVLALTALANIVVGVSLLTNDAALNNRKYFPDSIRSYGFEGREVGFRNVSFVAAYAILWSIWFVWFWLYTLIMRAWEYEKAVQRQRNNVFCCQHNGQAQPKRFSQISI